MIITTNICQNNTFTFFLPYCTALCVSLNVNRKTLRAVSSCLQRCLTYGSFWRLSERDFCYN